MKESNRSHYFLLLISQYLYIYTPLLPRSQENGTKPPYSTLEKGAGLKQGYHPSIYFLGLHPWNEAQVVS